LKAGAEAVLRTQAYPGEDFRGRLVLVGDVVDAGTRTVEGRVEVPNPGLLKPGMYVDASVAGRGERPLAVPESALQDDEARRGLLSRRERTFTGARSRPANGSPGTSRSSAASRKGRPSSLREASS
jgi:multidrug efflux pump subunit AcrA (membrane-fusion protein)